MREQFRFDSEGLDEDEAFARYADLYGFGTDVRRTTGPFNAQVRAWRMDRIILFDRWLNGVEHSREGRVRDDGFSHYVLTLVLEGEVRARFPRGQAVLKPGDLLVVDTRRPAATEPIEAHILTVSVSRAVGAMALGGVQGLHGRVFRAPAPAVLAAFLEAVTQAIDSMSPAATPSLGRAFAEILAAVGATSLDRATTSAVRREAVQRAAVRSLVESRLADPDLSVETISQATAISRAALYRLFENDGGVMAFVRALRIDAARSRMDQAAEADLASIAAGIGYSDPERFGRDFGKMVGVGPAEYLHLLADLRNAPSGSVEKLRWRFWMRELD